MEDDYDYDDGMDGDFDSGMASAGFGTDEDYGFYGNDADESPTFEDSLWRATAPPVRDTLTGMAGR